MNPGSTSGPGSPEPTSPRRPGRYTLIIGGTAALTLVAAGVVFAASAGAAATGCQASYSVGAQWQGGFVASVTVKNLGDQIDRWTLGWTFPDQGQQVGQGWGATLTQRGAEVTATSAGWNGTLRPGATTTVGFSGSWSGKNPAPQRFTLNGTACTGGTGEASASGSATGTGPASPSGSGSATSTEPPAASQTPPAGSANATGLIGWAAANGGTTGGAGGQTVTVTSASALDSALRSAGPTIVRVSGMISLSGMHQVTSNKTVLGVGANSGITGGGLNISGAKNVIIQNLVFRNADDDAINVQESTNVWIDHNDLAAGYDGLVDVKRGSDYVTVSWNRTHDHDKNMLLGHSDGNGSQDTGHLRVTYHHNWFDGTKQRNPRVRFGNPVHVFNNYFGGVGSYGVASTCGAGVLVESNYFENTKDPFHLGEGDSPAGSLVARNNHLVNSGAGQAGGSVANLPYSYAPDPASSVKSIVTAGAGTGKI